MQLLYFGAYPRYQVINCTCYIFRQLHKNANNLRTKYVTESIKSVKKAANVICPQKL
jgi:hypothetical protein